MQNHKWIGAMVAVVTIAGCSGAPPVTPAAPTFSVCYHPFWSPDGKRIAFIADAEADDVTELYLVEADGSDLKQIAVDGRDKSNPVWSPDGTRILFQSNRSGGGDLYTMRPDGLDIVRVTDAPAAEFSPAYSPDGARIAYCSNAHGDWDLFVMRADGSGETAILRD